MQHSNGQNEGTVKPVSDVNVTHKTFADRAEKQYRVCHPDQCDEDIDRPFKLGVFLALGPAQRQCQHGAKDDRLPTPENKGCQLVGDQANMAGSLYNVQGRAYQTTTTKGKNYRIGM